MRISRTSLLVSAAALLVVIGVGAAVYRVFRKDSVAPAPVSESLAPQREVIGMSVQGRKIEAYTYGTGEKNVLFVGGIHGGYEWNSVLLAYEFIDYLEKNSSLIPKNVTVTVIPALNPDGLYKVTRKEGRFTVANVSRDAKTLAAGRFNANSVDLNRNFACNWKPKSTWQNRTVSAGTKAFSEPEAAALRDYILKTKPDGVVFWHSQANAVYASECNNGILPGTLDIMNAYAKAAKYPAVKSFTAYSINGDSEGWLASIGIPAITVELKTHEDIEWDKNLAGIRALLDYFARK